MAHNYTIYQLNGNNANVQASRKMFEGWNILNKFCGGFNFDEYKEVYKGEIVSSDSEIKMLDIIFMVFNTSSRPDDFRGHSLSVSDVVEIDGVKYFCDSFGWKMIN